MKRILFSLVLAALLSMSVMGALAATTVLVTQNTTTWGPASGNAGGTVSWSSAYGAPTTALGTSALKLTTTSAGSAKADLYTLAGVPLADVETLSYWTYQDSASFSGGDASYQVRIFACGPGLGFTTLVFEPYQNGAVLADEWQEWDVDAGQFWSSRTVDCAGGAVNELEAGGGGEPFYSIAGLQTALPNAEVIAIGVNVGSNNPDYVVAVDGVVFNDTTYNFEIGTTPTTKDECKNGGWMTFNEPTFTNQGDCIQFVNTGK